MKQALVVLGMHRSGTSSLAGLLCRLGAVAPRTLMPEHPDNPRGYWESLAIMEANDRILDARGSSWSDWRAQTAETSAADRERIVADLVAVVGSEFQAASPIMVKDPRMCLLYPVWHRALETAGYAPKVLMPLRAPLEVAASLMKAHVFSQSDGLFLWLRHVLEAEVATRGTPRHVLRWTDLIADWRSEIDKASKRLGVALPALADEADPIPETFIDGALRHQVAQGALPDYAREWIGGAAAALDRLVDDPTDPDALLKLDAIRTAFDDGTRNFGPVLIEMREQLKDVTHERNLQMMARAETEAFLQEHMERSRIAETALEAARLDAEAIQGDHRRALASLDDRLAAAESSRDEALAELETARAERDRLADEMAGSVAREAALSARNSERANRLARLGDELGWRIAALEDARGRLAQAEADRASLTEAVEAGAAREAALTDRVADAQTRLADAQARIEDLTADSKRMEKEAAEAARAAREVSEDLEARLAASEAMLDTARVELSRWPHRAAAAMLRPFSPRADPEA